MYTLLRKAKCSKVFHFLTLYISYGDFFSLTFITAPGCETLMFGEKRRKVSTLGDLHLSLQQFILYSSDFPIPSLFSRLWPQESLITYVPLCFSFPGAALCPVILLSNTSEKSLKFLLWLVIGHQDEVLTLKLLNTESNCQASLHSGTYDYPYFVFV